MSHCKMHPIVTMPVSFWTLFSYVEVKKEAASWLERMNKEGHVVALAIYC